MLNSPCRVLLVEDEAEDIENVANMLGNVSSTFFRQGIELKYAETMAEAKQMLANYDFEVILLDLMLPDSRNMDSLKELQATVNNIPIVVQTTLEDEVVAVQALELGACGYLPKVACDRNLLLYAIRSAIERQQQLLASEQPDRQQELNNLDDLMDGAADNKQDVSLRYRMPDVFGELKQKYQQILTSFVEQKIYKVERELQGEIIIFVEQLGYLQATPKDLIEIHTGVLQHQSADRHYFKAFTVEGRYLLLELMGRLAAYYRRYYIGLYKINLNQNED